MTKAKETNRIAFVIGHTRNAQGAYSPALGMTEYEFSKKVAEHLPFDIYEHNHAIAGYTARQKDTAARIGRNYDIVIESHFNSSGNDTVQGCEALYFHTSQLGKRWAEIYSQRIAKEYEIRERGAKPLNSDNQNGFGFVRSMHPPAIILEPFFGSNKDAAKFADVKKYAEILIDIFC